LEAKIRIPQPLLAVVSSWIGYFRDTLATLQRAICFALVLLLFLSRSGTTVLSSTWVYLGNNNSSELEKELE